MSIEYISFGDSAALQNRGYPTNTSKRAMPTEIETSSGVCTPRYILDSGTRMHMAIDAILTQSVLLARAMPPKSPTDVWVCPLGKEYPVAPSRADSTIVKFGS